MDVRQFVGNLKLVFMNTIPNAYLEPMLCLNLGHWTQFTVYLVLNLSSSENVTLNLMDSTCSGFSHMYFVVFVFVMFALFSLILVCFIRNHSLIGFTEYDTCRKSVKEYAILVNLQVKLSCEKYRRESTKSGNNLKGFW